MNPPNFNGIKKFSLFRDTTIRTNLEKLSTKVVSSYSIELDFDILGLTSTLLF